MPLTADQNARIVAEETAQRQRDATFASAFTPLAVAACSARVQRLLFVDEVVRTSEWPDSVIKTMHTELVGARDRIADTVRVFAGNPQYLRQHVGGLPVRLFRYFGYSPEGMLPRITPEMDRLLTSAETAVAASKARIESIRAEELSPDRATERAAAEAAWRAATDPDGSGPAQGSLP